MSALPAAHAYRSAPPPRSPRGRPMSSTRTPAWNASGILTHRSARKSARLPIRPSSRHKDPVIPKRNPLCGDFFVYGAEHSPPCPLWKPYGLVSCRVGIGQLSCTEAGDLRVPRSLGYPRRWWRRKTLWLWESPLGGVKRLTWGGKIPILYVDWEGIPGGN